MIVKPRRQNTLKKEFSVSGRGLHKGADVKFTFHPAPADNGIIIRNNGEEYRLGPGLVFDTKRGTSIKKGNSIIHTVEHMVSALCGLNIDNVFIEAEGDEPPALDGSAWPFCEAALRAGISTQAAEAKYISLREPVALNAGAGKALVALPYDGYKVHYFADFTAAGLALQEFSSLVQPEIYARAIAPARTFGFKNELDALIKAGLIKGADLTNAVLIDNGKPVNTKFRYDNELARHKALDMVGDLGLLGCRLNACVIAVRTGHTENVELARRLMEL